MSNKTVAKKICRTGANFSHSKQTWRTRHALFASCAPSPLHAHLKKAKNSACSAGYTKKKAKENVNIMV